MTKRLPAEPAPGPLEGYAARFCLRIRRVKQQPSLKLNDSKLPGLVDVVEDRFDAVVADSGAVLDVAGTLEVGKGCFDAPL